MSLPAMAPRRPQVADRLIALREDLGISQEEAVARTNGAVTLRQWQRWEKGDSEPYKRNLAILSSAFDIPISEFFGETAAPTNDRLDAIERQLRDLSALVRERLPEREPSIIDGVGEDPDAPGDAQDEQAG